MEKKIRGDNYELQIYYYLTSIYKDHEIFLWSNVPIKYLIELKFIDNNNNEDIKNIKQVKDIGCDILMRNMATNKFIFVQCKNYNNKNICINDLGGFPFLLLNRINVDGILISNSDVSKNIKREITIEKRIIHLIIKYEEMLKSIEANEINHNNNINNKIIPYQYQIEAYNHLINKKRAICHMPCGTGKTIVAIMLAKNYDNIIIFTPLLLFASQLLDNFISEFNYNNVLVNSDGIRDINKIKLSDKNIISATFKSADIVNKIINNNQMNKCLVIVDEFHNLTENNVTNKDDEFNKILINDKLNFLFLSATPKLYNFSTEINKLIFGNIEYCYSFADAIKNKHINDYRIIIPNKKNEYDKYQFIYHNILFYGYYKCIIYCENKNKANEMINGIKNGNIYDMPIYIDVMTYKTNSKKRNEILKRFQENTILSIIVSVHILDECVNIPECDSIYISYKNKFQEKTIQRICRCMRIHPSKRQKSGIFLYCKKISEIQNYFNEIIDNKIELNIDENQKEIMDNYASNKNIINFDSKNKEIDVKINLETNLETNLEINENFFSSLNILNDKIQNDKIQNDKIQTINLDIVIKHLKSRKDSIKRLLINNFSIGRDYLIEQIKIINKDNTRGAYYKENILLTPDTFKKLCLISQSRNAKKIRNEIFQLKNPI